MRTTRTLACALGFLVTLVGCETSSGRLHVAAGDTDRLQGFYVEVFDPQGVIAAQQVRFDGHDLAAAELELPAGRFDVVLTPTDGDGQPIEGCQPASGEVTVVPDGLTGIHLVPECGEPGAHAPIPTQPAPRPQIVGFDFDGSKARRTCETLWLRAQVRYAGTAPLTWTWLVTGAPANAAYMARPDVEILEFLPSTPGEYAFTLKVCAPGKDGCAELTIPVRIRRSKDLDKDGIGDCPAP